MTATSRATSGPFARLAGLPRLWIFAVAAASEIFLLSFLFDSPRLGLEPWQEPIFYINALAKILVVAAPLLVILAWPRVRELVEVLEACASDQLKPAVAANALIFAVLLATRLAIAMLPAPTYQTLIPYVCLFLATGASLALIAAPLRFWRDLASRMPLEMATAVVGGGLAVGGGRLAQDLWYPLSDATLGLSRRLLALYETAPLLDSEQRVLSVGDFSVRVSDVCSGYEGIALVVAILALYMLVFRRELRFPNALILLPLGVATVWLLNALRIALLVSIGAHFSPEVAVQGFHSQAGWIGFLLVALACVAASQRMPFFMARAAPHASPVRAETVTATAQAQPTLVYLAPFIALVASGILASAFAPHDQWLYGLKVVAVGGTLWYFRASYRGLLSGVSPLAIAAGLAIGSIWIATDPGRAADTPLGAWIDTLPLWVAAAWVGMRALGSVLLVPLTEELAFRGYLARVLVSSKFEVVSFGAFRPLAFVVSSVAFGLLHQRWLIACLAGAAYALLMYRSKRLSDPIAAHMASNAVIIVWVTAVGQWSLL